ncbi:MAG TPA: polymer-forming cytoskeletal protein [Gemmatimonadales bacterium]|nr:polymer-forming cytoskeletal protein [Gemmatimonadales bacterium]
MSLLREDPKPSSRADVRRADGALSIIASGTVITGDLRADGTIKIEGEVLGNVQAAQQVLLARGSHVRGDVQAREAVIGGVVEGAIRATDRVEIQSTAVVTGDVTTQRIVIAEGGQVNGGLVMTKKPAANGPELVKG